MTQRTSGRSGSEPVLLSGGNPQIAKGYGDEPVQAWIAASPGWKKDVGERIDAIVEQVVPGVEKAVKWNSPFYGRTRGEWFLSLHVYTRYVQVAFFRGTSLEPVPDGKSKHPEMRYFNIHEDEDFADRLAAWVKQASKLPGEKL